MSPGAKVFLSLAGVGTLIGVVVLAGSKNASAATKPKPQVPGDNTPPDLIVPPLAPAQPSPQPFPQASQQAPQQAQPLPQVTIPTIPIAAQQPAQVPAQSPAAQVPPGVTFSVPNPLGGAPLGTFDPATGNVFGPNGLIIGTFDPIRGIFTTLTGQAVQIPGFGSPAAPAPPPAAPAQTLPPPFVPVLPPQPQAPAAPAAQSPATTVSSDTANMVHALLDAETRPGWNAVDPSVQVWQKARPPLVIDGKFGPKTALTVAQEFGTVPLVRFWPLGSSKAKLLQDYRAALITLANNSSDPVRADQLRQSAAREQAQAFSTKGKLPPVPVDQQIAIAKVA